VPYPPRSQLRPLPEFAGTASPRPDPAVQARVERFMLEQYAAGRSLREIAELTDRSFSAVRNILDEHGVQRRERGAATVAHASVRLDFSGRQPKSSAPDSRRRKCATLDTDVLLDKRQGGCYGPRERCCGVHP